MRALAILAFLFLILPLLLLAAGQFGLMSGRAPANLGVREGKLAPPSRTENSVSSQAALWPDGEFAASYARIDPLPARGGAAAAMSRLRQVLSTRPGARIIEDTPDYLRVEFETRWLRFVDDAEFWFDAGSNVIQVRSASRLGSKDFGVNRARIEALRATLTKA
jgi:uncharacterized protein (DUF1499 family)